jgi:hypothetical protein
VAESTFVSQAVCFHRCVNVTFPDKAIGRNVAERVVPLFPLGESTQVAGGKRLGMGLFVVKVSEQAKSHGLE